MLEGGQGLEGWQGLTLGHSCGARPRRQPASGDDDPAKGRGWKGSKGGKGTGGGCKGWERKGGKAGGKVGNKCWKGGKGSKGGKG